ncbi:unnamed protein product [Penicillium roqueforti FM164]|uniref:Genomic scaffold, ProqFM164S02 n=1 Tax=Penicillium roqueforti (strain FM164) TaxID=1365484 RepID=W6Q4X0_PENRF|nr:unnamed protein product [Penicillium roqueforti FM164]
MYRPHIDLAEEPGGRSIAVESSHSCNLCAKGILPWSQIELEYCCSGSFRGWAECPTSNLDLHCV